MNKSNKVTERKFYRYLAGFLLAFLALNAFGGGYYAMAGAEGVPLELLEGSPFSNYFIPGLFLFVVLGGSCLFSAIALFARWQIARKAAIFTALLILMWIIIQVSIIGYMSWMQPVTALLALVILALAWLLPHKQMPEATYMDN
ncbi:MAG: hypothetical protein V2I46_08440 [Bacteroides sp.]|jgi:hypothetical protein|nr:hypothetical protein [Bacteroides sp.]